MSAKDALASGARSATFSAGRAKKNDPIKFNKTVAKPELREAEISEVEEIFYRDSAKDNPVLATLIKAYDADESKPKPDLSRYQPMNDRVLLRRIVEKSENIIVQPDAFTLKSNKGEVIAVGSGMLIGPNIVPIELRPGDVVTFGEYNAEPVGVEGEELLLVSAFDIRLKILA